MPLPDLDSLNEACHYIGEGVGEHEGFTMYLCASEHTNEFTACELSDTFTRHYGTEVYLCRGAHV